MEDADAAAADDDDMEEEDTKQPYNNTPLPCVCLVLYMQTLAQTKAKNMLIKIEGDLSPLQLFEDQNKMLRIK